MDKKTAVSPAAPSTGASAPFKEWSWILTLFGTAVGAGILYLPLQVGSTGVWALACLSFLVFPLIHYSHKAIVELLLGERDDIDYTGVTERHLGRFFGGVFTVTYLITFFAILFSYSIGMNANLGDFLFHSEVTSTNWANGPWLSFLILAVFAILQVLGKKVVLSLMSAISFGLILLLIGISLYLIPFWDFTEYRQLPSLRDFGADVLLILPILTFSFIFFPPIPAMVSDLRHAGCPDGTARLSRTVMRTSVLLLFFVLLFVYACLFALTPEEFKEAAAENLNCLTILSYKPEIPHLMADLSAIIGLAALITSFIGVFFAVWESARQLLDDALSLAARIVPRVASLSKRRRTVDAALMLVLYGGLWMLTLLNPPVMDLFGRVLSPLVGIFLFILPILLLVKIHGLGILKRPSCVFVLLTGILILFSFKLGTWLHQQAGG